MSEHEADARAERKAIYAKRKDFTAAFGSFVRTMRDAMTGYLGMRAQGVEREDAIKGLESVIRDTWPKPTTKYPPACDLCEDTGYQQHLCRQYARCERVNCNQKGESWQHLYVRPCECVKGQRFEPKARYTPELATVGKVAKKRGGFSRMAQ